MFGWKFLKIPSLQVEEKWNSWIMLMFVKQNIKPIRCVVKKLFHCATWSNYLIPGSGIQMFAHRIWGSRSWEILISSNTIWNLIVVPLFWPDVPEDICNSVNCVATLLLFQLQRFPGPWTNVAPEKTILEMDGFQRLMKFTWLLRLGSGTDFCTESGDFRGTYNMSIWICLCRNPDTDANSVNIKISIHQYWHQYQYDWNALNWDTGANILPSPYFPTRDKVPPPLPHLACEMQFP